MQLAVLFWFYKDVDLCINRLRLLKKHNPDTPIYGLYGGAAEQASFFSSKLADYLDDFYQFTPERDTEWKWRNGDIMIADWYRERGRLLVWDTIVVVQWDMVIMAPLKEVFSDLKPGELLISGIRPVRETASWWCWVNGENEPEYQRFTTHLQSAFGFEEEPLCHVFIVVCMPRNFLEGYAQIALPDQGFIEYRVGTYARVLGVPISQHEKFKPCWSEDPDPSMRKIKRILNGVALEVPVSLLTWQLLLPNGFRVFHPFELYLPLDFRSTFKFAAGTISPKRHYKKITHRAKMLFLRVRSALKSS